MRLMFLRRKIMSHIHHSYEKDHIRYVGHIIGPTQHGTMCFLVSPNTLISKYRGQQNTQWYSYSYISRSIHNSHNKQICSLRFLQATYSKLLSVTHMHTSLNIHYIRLGETDLIQSIDHDVTNINTISKSFIATPWKFKCLVQNNK